MYNEGKIWIGKSGDEKVFIYPKMSNRHGMIAGATGTGKTVTLKVMAESFSDAGVPVFLADAKGDLAGMCLKGVDNEDMQERIVRFGLDKENYEFKNYPANYWDVYQEKGIPLRTTVSEVGPLLMSRILNLNETQTAILTVVYKIADDNDLLLIDTKDLRAMLTYVGENAKDFSLEYGNMSKQSIAAIVRSIIALESDGGDIFFGETALNIKDWIRTNCDGKGMINILDCQKLINHPTMYSTFLLWMISELYENLPEAGDLSKPKMVFFFDEAHMLFDTASKALLEKITQVVKLIRSKGVGIYFITQNPRDIPDEILAQLGNKIQHALRAYTPAELKAAKAAADSYRVNPEFDTYDTLINLGTGEAIVSVLDEEGVPTIVKKTSILPPQSKMGAIEDSVRDEQIKNSELFIKYEESHDPDSAYEFLQRKGIEEEEAARKADEERLAQIEKEKEEAALAKQKEKEEAAALRQKEKEEAAALRQKEKEEAAALRQKEKEEAAAKKAAEKEEAAALAKAEKEKAARTKSIKRATKNVASSTAGTVGREIGNAVGNSVGGKFGKSLGGNIGASLGRGIIGTLFKM